METVTDPSGTIREMTTEQELVSLLREALVELRGMDQQIHGEWCIGKYEPIDLIYRIEARLAEPGI